MKGFATTYILAAAGIAQLTVATPVFSHAYQQHGHMASNHVSVTTIFVTSCVSSSSASSPTSAASSIDIPSAATSKVSVVSSVITSSAVTSSITVVRSTYSSTTSPSSSSSSTTMISIYQVSKVVSTTVATTSSSIARGGTSPTTLASGTSASAVTSAASVPKIASTTTVSSSSTIYTPSSKAGLSGYAGVQSKSGFEALAPHISWYSDYSPITPDAGAVKGIPMLWGDASSCTTLAGANTRYQEFLDLAAIPDIMFGFFEPDCDCPSSSSISDPSDGTTQWNKLLAPLGAKGTTLGSPSMCKQKDEDWLTPFEAAVDQTWDYTSIHINVNSLAAVKADVEYYAAKYKRPIWVTEFACVDSKNGFTPCSDQAEIDTFIQEAVSFFQSNDTVVAYGPSNGEGLGTVWPLFDSATGALSASGTAYLNAIKAL